MQPNSIYRKVGKFRPSSETNKKQRNQWVDCRNAETETYAYSILKRNNNANVCRWNKCSLKHCLTVLMGYHFVFSSASCSSSEHYDYNAHVLHSKFHSKWSSLSSKQLKNVHRNHMNTYYLSASHAMCIEWKTMNEPYARLYA